MGPFTALMTVEHAVTADHAEKRSFVGAIADRVTSFVAAVRHDAADRRLRDQLADMDDAMLRDIGIADDELHLIRVRDSFTPRAWANRGTTTTRWEF